MGVPQIHWGKYLSLPKEKRKFLGKRENVVSLKYKRGPPKRGDFF